jgi:hypothetical protein
VLLGSENVFRKKVIIMNIKFNEEFAEGINNEDPELLAKWNLEHEKIDADQD